MVHAENHLLHNVYGQVCFTTECKLHANAYLSVSTSLFVGVVKQNNFGLSIVREQRLITH